MGQTSEAYEHVLDVMRSGQSVLIEGPPGCNKSQAMAPGGEVHTQRARELGIDPSEYGYIDYRPALEDPTESKGIPFPDLESRRTVWLLPDWVPEDGFGLLCIEEIGNASKAHHSALYQLTQERRLKDYKLPDGWDIVATANRKTDGCGVNRLPTALVNRFSKVTWLPDAKDWVEWAHVNGVDRRIIAAVNWMPDLIEKFDGTIDGPQSTGRSVTAFAKIFAASGCEVTGNTQRGEISKQGDDMRVFRQARGAIGEEDGARMVSFLGCFARLPDIKAILKGKDVPAPSDADMDVAFAAMSKLAELSDRQTIGNVLGWIDKLGNPLRAVFAADVSKQSAGKTDTFMDWMGRNSYLLS